MGRWGDKKGLCDGKTADIVRYRLPSHPMHTSALVLFSGGQDSTTCLAHALSRYERVETLALDYGQRHKVELDARLNVLAAIKEAIRDTGVAALYITHDLAVVAQVADDILVLRHGG